MTNQEIYDAVIVMKLMVEELYRIRGLDISNPMTETPESLVAGDISQVWSGDGVTTKTITRQ